MDIGFVATLNKIAFEQSKDKTAKDNRAAGELEDAIIDG
jgi:hypothetical protein